MRSLRRTLAVRFSVTTLLALLLIGLWAFLGTHYRLSRQLDESLTAALQLETALLAERTSLTIQQGSHDLESFVRQVNRFVSVFDSAGRFVVANSPFAKELPADSVGVQHALAGGSYFSTTRWNGHSIRSLYAPVPPGSRSGYAVIRVASSVQPLSSVEQSIFLLILGTVLLGTVVTAAGAGWLANSAIAPVAAVTAQAEEITPGAEGNRITAHADVAEFTGLVAVLNRMLERLDGAVQSQRRIIANLGHDLRTPLTAMRGELEVALRSERSPDDYRRVLQSCLEEVEHLSSISESVVLLARIETGQLRPEPSAIDIARLAGEAVRRAGARAEAREIRMRVQDGPEVTAWADAKLVRLVLDHLLDNAIKHTPGGSQVLAAVGADTTSAHLAVEDDGPGIPDEELPYLFERLYRADPARTRSSGAGLGLTIVQAIVQAHGGRMTASRSGLGGLRIAVELPRAGRPPDGDRAGP